MRAGWREMERVWHEGGFARVRTAQRPAASGKAAPRQGTHLASRHVLRYPRQHVRRLRRRRLLLLLTQEERLGAAANRHNRIGVGGRRRAAAAVQVEVCQGAGGRGAGGEGLCVLSARGHLGTVLLHRPVWPTRSRRGGL